jgi:hypothetical protein
MLSEYWTVETGGGRYALVAWRGSRGGIGVAWPDGRWSVADLSVHAPPEAGWLEEQGLLPADARAVAAALAERWAALTRDVYPPVAPNPRSTRRPPG